jgi:hypothetical protein
MPFIDTPVEHHFPWYVKLFFWNQKRRHGAVLEPARLWGRSRCSTEPWIDVPRPSS